MRDVVCWGSGKDGIVIAGIALGLGKALLSACGAAVPIGELGSLAVVRADDELGIDGHFMHRAVGPVDQLFRMAQRPAFVVAAGVAGVGRRGGVTAIECRGQRAITDLADEAAIAGGLEFSIPARG